MNGRAMFGNKHDMKQKAGRSALKKAAERSGLRIDEYLASVGLTREEFVDQGKRPANYGDEKRPSEHIKRKAAAR